MRAFPGRVLLALLLLAATACIRNDDEGDGPAVPPQDDQPLPTDTAWTHHALLAGVDLFVGVDSSPMHIAQALGRPTVGVFGVTDSRFIMTDGSPHVGCDADPAKAPRSGERHRIPGACHIDEDGTAIHTVTVEQVMEAVRTVI